MPTAADELGTVAGRPIHTGAFILARNTCQRPDRLASSLAPVMSGIYLDHAPFGAIAGDKISGRRGTYWRDAIGSADWIRVERVSGVESEMELAFAALQQRCAPMLGGLGAATELLIGGLRDRLARELLAVHEYAAATAP